MGHLHTAEPQTGAAERPIDRATQARQRRARMRTDLRVRRVMPQTLIAAPPWWLESMRLGAFLRSMPRVGEKRAQALLDSATELLQAKHAGAGPIHPDRELGNLMLAERRALILTVVRYIYTDKP